MTFTKLRQMTIWIARLSQAYREWMAFCDAGTYLALICRQQLNGPALQLFIEET
jgi:hypothetical protein